MLCALIIVENFNPRSPCGERHGGPGTPRCRRLISIHAPRAGSDRTSAIWRRLEAYFNPRSPCGERQLAFVYKIDAGAFQSTLPVRGATSTDCRRQCAERISIHAPRAGSDKPLEQHPRTVDNFNPRSPCGERPLPCLCASRWRCISIHAPRAGSDSPFFSRLSSLRIFQSTLPVRGATSARQRRRTIMPLFQSTLPVRGATSD